MALIGINGKIGSGKDTVGQIIQYLVCVSKDTLAPHQKFEDLAKQIQEFGLAPISNKIQSGWEIKKFAGKLKQIASILTGATLEQLEDQDFKKQYMGESWRKLTGAMSEQGLGELMTYRELLQTIGTEAMRNGLHENVWVNALMADYKLQGYSYTVEGNKVASEIEHLYPNWIITDMRFPNEMDAVKAKGGITIRVNRPTKDLFGNNVYAQLPLTIMTQHPSETALDNHEFDYVIDNDGSISDLVEKVRKILTLNNII